MASFFPPPGSGDPVIIECQSSTSKSHPSSPLVYCNRLVAPEERLQTPLQYFTFVIAVTCLVVPVLRWALDVSYRFVRCPTRNRGRRTSPKLVKRKPARIPVPIEVSLLSSVTSFRFVSENQSLESFEETPAVPGELFILPLRDPQHHQPINVSQSRSQASTTCILGLVDYCDITASTLPAWLNSIINLCGEQMHGTVKGIVLRVGSDSGETVPAELDTFLWELNNKGIPVILNLPHDTEIYEQIRFSLISGVIVDNACILPDGQRRDYFRSHNLRRIMNQCAEGRRQRPGFFVGFHDVWDLCRQPSAALICRAVKVAAHFEAVLEYGPREGEQQGLGRRLPPSLSGIEYLRRAEVSQMQQEWVNHRREIAVQPDQHTQDRQTSGLDLDELESIVQGAKELLRPAVQDTGRQDTCPDETERPLPQCSLGLPSSNFWECDNGVQISGAGCAPLTRSPTRQQYGAIVETQVHLRDLNMLQHFQPDEVSKTVRDLNHLRATSRHRSLLLALQQGLLEGTVLVYKGLATGFTVPDNAAEFWGVSTYRVTEGIVDIFISRNCPSDTSTILHTWLAHHDVPREERYEEEMLLEEGGDACSGLGLPLSMRTAIKMSTPSEILWLLRRVQSSDTRHPFLSALRNFCNTVLDHDSDLEAMNVATSSGFLSGSVTMEELLIRRLSEYSLAGASTLPSIEHLVQLSQRVQEVIQNALFTGDRETLSRLTTVLSQAYQTGQTNTKFIDINADLVMLMYFCALRKAALEDVYLEATDHCPIFSQPDQAAVFAELWMLGSQCELYFCMKPRALGQIIYDRHRSLLKELPPKTLEGSEDNALGGGGLMSVYAKAETTKDAGAKTSTHEASKSSLRKLLRRISVMFMEFGALSIFCLPAVLDLVLLTFLGRGLFMTAYMGEEKLVACCYGLLVSLLISAGVTGWVGSVVSYYLCNHAYHNMIFFHVQRLSGGFMLSLVAGLIGGVIFGVKVSLTSAFTFFAYTVLLTNYLNALGMMAMMHQPGSPLRSGRAVLWPMIPLLLTSPILSSLLNGYDLPIYLGVGYAFLILLLFQYRSLCHEWMTWLDNIPVFTEQDILDWYNGPLQMQRERQSGSTTQVSVTSEATEANSSTSESTSKAAAVRAFRQAVTACQHNLIQRSGDSASSNGNNHLVHQVAKGLPFIDWAIQSDLGDQTQSKKNEVFSVPWFAQVVEALKKRKQMVQGLKEHSIFMLYRYARLDIGQNIGLFLIFLMDRWVSVVMSAASVPISIFSDYTSRYAICFAISYFCFSVMVLDYTLQGYWSVSFEFSDERVSSLEEAADVSRAWERSRRRKYISALFILVRRMLFLFGCTTILVWFFVKKTDVLEIYYLYSLGYTAVVIFQFNRCFTTNVHNHVVSLLGSAGVGFITGCILHAIYKDSPPIYIDVVALNTASILAALLTSIFVWKDFSVSSFEEQLASPGTHSHSEKGKSSVSEDLSPVPDGHRDIQSHIMNQLCLGVDVDVEWLELPSTVRQAIISRVLQQPVHISPEMKSWMDTRGLNIDEIDLGLLPPLAEDRSIRDTTLKTNLQAASTTPRLSLVTRRGKYIHKAWVIIAGVPLSLAKWIAMISAGDSNIERELSYTLRHTGPLRGIFICAILLVWNLCRYVRDTWTYSVLIFQRKALVDITRLARHGASRVLCEDRIIVEQRLNTVTGFLSRTDTHDLKVEVFQRTLSEKPVDTKPDLIATYDPGYRLCSVHQGEGRKATKTKTTYIYAPENKTRVPNSKAVRQGDDNYKTYSYDKKGRAIQGTIGFGLSEYTFQFFYAGDSDDVFKAVFKAAEPGSVDSLTVYWGTPLNFDKTSTSGWIPSVRKSRVEKKIGDQTFIITYDYQHCRDPVVTTTVILGTGETRELAKAPRLFDHEELLWERPSDVLFEHDDLLLHHNTRDIQRAVALSGQKVSWRTLLRPSYWKYRSKKVLYRSVSTGWLRTELWNSWRSSGQLDAITACWMDELILRNERTLSQYWNWRNLGLLDRARQVLDSKIHRIVPSIEIAQDISEVCLLPIKTTDLYAMGLGKDANQITTRPRDCFQDMPERISVIFNDVGCWPDAPGGVSNCRRDLVNGHSTIRNHVLAESGNEYGIPRFQVEKNVQSLKLVPLWGLDCRTPNHGIIDNLLESQVDEKIDSTDIRRDVVDKFIPLLKLFVKGARSKLISKRYIITYSNVMLDMFKYFEHKDYNKTWKSKEVASAWVKAWLTPYDDPDITNPDEYFEIEKPSLSDFRTALSIYTSYFFIFSVQTPEKCPQVFQSTHHGISSLFGMLLKHRRGTTFGIWDHAILWRECCLNISPAQSTLSLPVQSMLLAGMGLAMRLAYFHADVVLPCTSVFNPVWEADLATDSGRQCNIHTFNRKIDPIVNGVSNMSSFQPVNQVQTSNPTVVMLSNVQFIKDIKNAIYAADIIVNRYGFKTYALHVYGARDREPEYAIDMAKLIESCGLSSHVLLKGFGKPQEILKDAWLFMNSSLSEGLPLAVAEAALAAVPVVATAVGATSLILTDPDDEAVCYGEVVPPNDPVALARAQVSILAMAGRWATFAGDSEIRCALPDVLTGQDVEWLTERMFEKTEARRYLGMLTRGVVLRGFHGERYLREHEQMYWAQWHLAKMRRDPSVMGDRWAVSNGVEWIDDEDRDREKESGGEGKEKEKEHEEDGMGGNERKGKLTRRSRKRKAVDGVDGGFV